ncbi:SIR2 family NAD-dependent protein deacylase [Peribacillus simplex]|uniref:SIR2 family NAD-dependent protein deacylase n=1 Tax=Peribacillus simplex TaxID=1478 RepID=UPI003D271A26
MNVINWPEHLITELAERRCIIFVGSGVSATAKNNSGRSPKTWGVFLEESLSLINEGSNQEFIKKLIREKNYLLALQCIYDHSDNNEYVNFLRNEFSTPNYQPNSIHRDIADIDSKIVITTNFDKIYEKACYGDGHTIINYTETNLIENLRSNQRLIIKAHGNINDIGNMIFTKRQYFEAKRQYSEFYNILSALFITNTILFIGCGLSDPDINLMLENVYKTTGTTMSHYVVSLDDVNPNIMKDWKDSYNINTLKYGPDYSDLAPNIENLKDAVLSYRAARV